MTARCVIREGTPEDRDIIVAYNRALAQETEDLHLDQTRLTTGVDTVLDDPVRGQYYMAESDGKVVGQLMITREWSDWRAGWFWWIQSVYVEQAYRGQGVFRALFDHVHDLARSFPNVVGLRLYVEPHNTAAMTAYRRAGMVEADYQLFEIDWAVDRQR